MGETGARCEHVPQPGAARTQGDNGERRARPGGWPRTAVCGRCGNPVIQQAARGPWVLRDDPDERLAAFLALHPEVTIDWDGSRASWLGDGELRKVEADSTARLVERLETAFAG